MPVYTSVFDRVRQMAKMPAGRPQSIAMQWLRDRIRDVDEHKFRPDRLVKGENTSSNVFIGKLCMFLYDAKTKEKLPYWDKFPLIFPLGMTKDGKHMLGLNFHYLPVQYRIALLDKLLQFANNQAWDETTKMTATYQMLQQAANYPEIAPCVKRYIPGRVSSRFIVVDSADWHISVFLPVERFQKARKEKVWRESVTMLSQRRKKKEGGI